MAIKFKHSNINATYFITFTCIDWMHLFEKTRSYDLVYKWFDILQQSHNAYVIAYVLMPNHLHVIIHFNDDTFDLNKIISNGKRFMAYEIINRLELENDTQTLALLSDRVTERERKKGQLHKVFIDSFDAKAIISNRFMIQKINYIHNNPVSGKWNLAKDFTGYEHSSASFYELQEIKHFLPQHYMDL